MLMKDGNPIPKVMVEALEKDIQALKIFMDMSETYQRLYVMRIQNRQYGDSIRERVEGMIKDIHKFGGDNQKR